MDSKTEAQAFKPGIRNDWTTKAGLRAVVLMTSMGHHCGYVAVPKGHPLHGVEYGTPCAALAPAGEDTPTEGRNPIAIFCAAGDESRLQAPDLVFGVHGGLTYSGGSEKYPAPSDGLWWFGFDCAHIDDGKDPTYLASLSPERAHWENRDGEFRDQPYVEAQCESLAAQIVAAVPFAAEGGAA